MHYGGGTRVVVGELCAGKGELQGRPATVWTGCPIAVSATPRCCAVIASTVCARRRAGVALLPTLSSVLLLTWSFPPVLASIPPTIARNCGLVTPPLSPSCFLPTCRCHSKFRSRWFIRGRKALVLKYATASSVVSSVPFAASLSCRVPHSRWRCCGRERVRVAKASNWAACHAALRYCRSTVKIVRARLASSALHWTTPRLPEAASAEKQTFHIPCADPAPPSSRSPADLPAYTAIQEHSGPPALALAPVRCAANRPSAQPRAECAATKRERRRQGQAHLEAPCCRRGKVPVPSPAPVGRAAACQPASPGSDLNCISENVRLKATWSEIWHVHLGWLPNESRWAAACAPLLIR
jgi:hypothetical protein